MSKYYISTFFNYFTKRMIFVFLIFGIIVFNFISSFNQVDNNKESVKELILIEKFLINKGFNDRKLKIYTNDLLISNLWLLNNNYNLLVSNGFTNSLTNTQIEYNLINTLKSIGVSEEQFENLIFLDKEKVRNEFFLDPFFYSYQANSLYTYSDITNYSPRMQKIINKTSPFRAQNQVVPDDEKKRLANSYKQHAINLNLKPDLAIINTKKYQGILSENNYRLLYSTKNYKIFVSN